ncbi:MAG: 4-hydroxy-tetrahydrodipicolinate synthase [Burkholderiales bacterium]|nr:4-hydroxy-tetrahydrodipicolinate synthase [Burkholderiales bacterium]
MLHGAITALVTPMDNEANIDFNALDRLVDFQIENQINGIVVAGSTGESATLSIDEKVAILNHVIARNNLRVKIIANISEANTKNAVEFTHTLNNIVGIDYVMAVTPCYMKPTQDGLYSHFAKIAQASVKPVILYNVPGRTSCDLHDVTALRLANDFSNIAGLKDATANIERACYLIKNKPQGFRLFSGDDGTAMAFMLCGGDGVISVVSNLIPNEMSQMSKLAILGDKLSSIKANNAIMQLYHDMFIEVNPIPIKWALYSKGIISTPNLRLPLTTLSEANQKMVKLNLN